MKAPTAFFLLRVGGTVWVSTGGETETSLGLGHCMEEMER